MLSIRRIVDISDAPEKNSVRKPSDCPIASCVRRHFFKITLLLASDIFGLGHLPNRPICLQRVFSALSFGYSSSDIGQKKPPPKGGALQKHAPLSGWDRVCILI